MFPKSYIFEVSYLDSHFDHVWLSPDDTEQRSISCPWCLSEMVPFIRTSNRDGSTVLEKSICGTCSYIRFTRMPSADWFSDYYKNVWDAVRTVGKQYNPESRAYVRNLELLRNYKVPHTASIFDFGAGYGQFLTACKVNGYTNLFGVELSKKRADYCRTELGLPVSNCEGRSIAEDEEIIASAPYDVVHSHAVFEHVDDLEGCLNAVARILKPDGLFMLHIPHFDDEPFVEIGHALVHLQQFCFRSVAALMAKHGFEILEMDRTISVVARKSSDLSKGNQEGIDWPIVLAKLNDTFGIDWERAADGSLMWFDLKPHRGRRPYGARASSLPIADNLKWYAKRAVLGVARPNLPIFGPSGSLENAFHVRNVGTKIARRVLDFGKMELGGRLLERQKETDAEPLVDFRYNSNTAVAFIK